VVKMSPRQVIIYDNAMKTDEDGDWGTRDIPKKTDIPE